jgi:hypothetical protein
MSDWQWLLNNGFAIVILIVVARWLAPRVDAFLQRLDARLDRNETRAVDGAQTVEENKVMLTRSEDRVAAQNNAILEMIRAARLSAEESLSGNKDIAKQVVRHLTEAERIIREAG